MVCAACWCCSGSLAAYIVFVFGWCVLFGFGLVAYLVASYLCFVLLAWSNVVDC